VINGVSCAGKLEDKSFVNVNLQLHSERYFHRERPRLHTLPSEKTFCFYNLRPNTYRYLSAAE